MKDKELFGILENAESDSMERLIEKCPEISDEQLDKILEMSERKFNNMKKKENAGNSNITMTENDTVKGVERSRRPAWRGPASMAASLILIAGIAIGSTALIKNGSKKPGTEPDINIGASVTDEASSTASDVAEISSESADTYSYLDPESTDITPFVGYWGYVVSETNNVEADGKMIGVLHISENGTTAFSTTDSMSGEAGIVRRDYEEIGGTKVIRLAFTGGVTAETTYFYSDESLNELHLGNGDSARLKRLDAPEIDLASFAGEWTYQVAVDNASVGEKSKNAGYIVIGKDGEYTFTDENGNVSTGQILESVELWENENDSGYRCEISFYEPDGNGLFRTRFNAVYDKNEADMLTIGEDGKSRLVRGRIIDTNADGKSAETSSGIDIAKLAGTWNYQGSAGRYTVDVKSIDMGTMVINPDSTFSFTDQDGNRTTGNIVIEEDTDIGGTPIRMLCFYEDGADKYDRSSAGFVAYYDAENTDVLPVGHGWKVQLVRNQKPVDPQMKAIAGEWKWEDADENGQPSAGKEVKASVTLRENGTFSYYGSDGESYDGIVVRSTETIGGQTHDTVNFYAGDEAKFENLKFGGYYHSGAPSYISIGNGGLSVLYNTAEANW